MRREQLEHLIRAAGAICESRHVLVIGSQSILGQYPEGAPERALLSMEADLMPLDTPSRTDLISGSLGEGSPFQETFGYYGEGVDLETAKLPDGWRERLVRIENANTNGFVGLCLDLHDLLVAKYFAGREKDHEFALALICAGLVNKEILLMRIAHTELSNERSTAMLAAIERHFARP
jgi:hypothetical protein